MNEEIEKPFLSIIDKVADFRQKGKLTYPSSSDYKECMANLISVLLRGKKGITVYYDYDCDGILSGVMLHRFLVNAFKIIRGDDSVDMVKLRGSNRQNSFGLTEEEFNQYQKDSDLVVTVDNGSDISFLSEDLKKTLLVLDHHPSKNRYSFVLNPNTGREEGQPEYSTSGGRIVYDFIKNIDLALKHYFPEYRAVENNRQLVTLRELASLTLISDMAIMDKENRDFVADSFDTMRADMGKLPIYTRLDKCNSKECSFNIISQINAMSRMEKDLDIVTRWVAPKSIEEWKELDAIIDANNTEKKDVVKKAFTYYLKEKEKKGTEDLIEFLELRDAPIGILGLLANRISAKENNKPVIVAGVKANGDISASARGENVKDAVLEIFEGNGGGHQDACGAKRVVREDSSLEKEFAFLKRATATYIEANAHKLQEMRKLESINEDPLTIGEFRGLCELYVEKSEGVNFYKNIYATISDFKVVGETVFPSGWVKVSLGDSENRAINFMFNGEEISLDDLKKEGMVAVMEFAPEDSYQIHSIFPRSELNKRVMPISESVELDITVKPIQEIIAMEATVEQNLWYYIHPESNSAWVSDKEEIERDPMVEEVTKEVFDGLSEKEWDISRTIQREDDMAIFIETENEKVLLIERYSEEIVLAHPDKVFVYGDNLVKKGKAGQAIIRHLPNAMGIPTKRLPSMHSEAFFSDKKDEGTHIVNSINAIFRAMRAEGKTIVFPANGVGTGYAEMETRSPQLYQAMNQLIVDNFTKAYAKFNMNFNAKKEASKLQYNTPTEKVSR